MFKLTLRSIFIFLLGIVSINVQAQSSEEVERRVQDDIMEKYPHIEEFSIQNQLVRVMAEFELNDTSYTMVYSSKGKWQHTVYGIHPDSVPEPVMEGFDKSKYAEGWEITAAEVYDTPARGVQYRISVSKSAIQKKYLYFNEKGRLMREALTI